jgi:hypothetical protein
MRFSSVLYAAFFLVCLLAARASDADTVPPGSCAWSAPPTLEVKDNTVLPSFIAPHFAPDAVVPSPLPSPVIRWNPVFPIDASGRIHGNHDGYVSSIVTASGAPCSGSSMTEVLVYSDDYQPQRSLSVGYGGSRVYDEYAPGETNWQAYTANAELESAFGLHNALFALDARSIGYTHPANAASLQTCPVSADPGCVSQPGGLQRYRTGFQARDESIEARFGDQLVSRGPALDAAYSADWTNTGRGYVSGFGFGVEVPPDLDLPLSGYGALTYYPTFAGSGVHYSGLRWRLGAAVSMYGWLHWQGFADVAWIGDRRIAITPTPATAELQGIVVSIGRRF